LTFADEERNRTAGNVGAVNAAGWTASDEGYLRAYQWAGALAGGAALPQEAAPIQLGPGEVAHARFSGLGVAGFFGEDKPYQPGFLLVGGPVGLAVTGAASLARNAAKKAEARRAAVPRWNRLGTADVTVTSQRLMASATAQTGSFWYAEMSPMQMAPGSAGIPAVEFQQARQPMLRLESPWAPMLYVFVHQIVDGRPPGVPMPTGLLERAQQQGRLR
jgi:hypothetical protein